MEKKKHALMTYFGRESFLVHELGLHFFQREIHKTVRTWSQRVFVDKCITNLEIASDSCFSTYSRTTCANLLSDITCSVYSYEHTNFASKPWLRFQLQHAP